MKTVTGSFNSCILSNAIIELLMRVMLVTALPFCFNCFFLCLFHPQVQPRDKKGKEEEEEEEETIKPAEARRQKKKRRADTPQKHSPLRIDTLYRRRTDHNDVIFRRMERSIFLSSLPI